MVSDTVIRRVIPFPRFVAVFGDLIRLAVAIAGRPLLWPLTASRKPAPSPTAPGHRVPRYLPGAASGNPVNASTIQRVIDDKAVALAVLRPLNPSDPSGHSAARLPLASH